MYNYNKLLKDLNIEKYAGIEELEKLFKELPKARQEYLNNIKLEVSFEVISNSKMSKGLCMYLSPKVNSPYYMILELMHAIGITPVGPYYSPVCSNLNSVSQNMYALSKRVELIDKITKYVEDNYKL